MQIVWKYDQIYMYHVWILLQLSYEIIIKSAKKALDVYGQETEPICSYRRCWHITSSGKCRHALNNATVVSSSPLRWAKSPLPLHFEYSPLYILIMWLQILNELWKNLWADTKWFIWNHWINWIWANSIQTNKKKATGTL
jgi:hypothetical protein